MAAWKTEPLIGVTKPSYRTDKRNVECTKQKPNEIFWNAEIRRCVVWAPGATKGDGTQCKISRVEKIHCKMIRLNERTMRMCAVFTKS